MNIQRKIKREKKKKDKKLEQKIKGKLMLFEGLPEHCVACEKEFDKQNKEMVTTWNVVVREKEKIVRLYCPECWGSAVNLVNEYFEEKENGTSA